MPPRHDSSVVLPQPLGPSRITERTGGHVEVESVDRADRISAAGVLDSQVLNG